MTDTRDALTAQTDLAGLFEQAVRLHADRIAVVCAGVSVGYRELGERTGERAPAIAAAGGGDRTPVALEMECSTEAVIAAVAVLRSGRPLIVLDQRLPEERRRQITTRAGADRMSPQDIAELEPAPHHPLPEIHETDCAVILFTSGSTGAPKGVRQGHRLWVNQASELAEVLGLGAGDRMAAILPLSFGGGVDIVMTALLGGAELHVFDPRVLGVDALPAWLIGTRPDTLHATPSLLRAMLSVCSGDELAGLRLVTTCGEAVHGDQIRALRRHLRPEALYCNLSGSSETGNLAFNLFGPDREIPEGFLPVGRVSERKRVRIVADDGTDLADGQLGTIVVESPCIAEGYFVDRNGVSTGDRDAFGVAQDGTPVFRLGDLGRFDSDGTLHLVGRRDDAVKIGGYFVEPAEVTAALLVLPGIDDAVVIGVHDDQASALIAYVATGVEKHELTVPGIRRELRESLPDWMVPSQVMVLSELPRNERGKIDRPALRELVRTSSDEPPVTETECDLAMVWQEILGRPRVSREDDFLSLGGDSLQVQQMLTRAGMVFGVTLGATALMMNPTLRTLACHIDGAARTAPKHSSTLVPLQVGGSLPTVFAFAGAGSPAVSMAPLARALDGGRPVYGLQAHGLEHRGFPDWTIGRAARRYLREIVEIQPTGPYFFVGHSLGGLIAIEVARILRRRGERIAGVVCLDTILAGPLSEGRTALWERGTETDGPDATQPPESENLWRTRLMLVTAGLWRHPTQTQWDLFHDLGRRVALMHRLRPWDGPVDVVMADDNPDDPDRWKTVAPAARSVSRIDGDHNGILRPPHVARTADIVRSILEREYT